MKEDKDIVLVELANILPFHTGDGHPFEVEDDEDMAELEASIDENGILEPVILRPDVNLEGRYEIIDGHKRCRAARRKGFSTVPSVIEICDDKTAIELMVVSNLGIDREFLEKKGYKVFCVQLDKEILEE